MPTALVTGATAGLGAEFARRLAGEGHDLVLVARDKERLDTCAASLREAYGVQVEVLPADLAEDEGCAGVERRLADAERPVDVLVNNAGFGLNTGFLRSSADDEERMLRVLVRAVLRLTHAAAGAMAARGRGEICNVASVAGLVPGGTYGASKAYVISLCESLAGPLGRKGVRISALCPGYTRTEFHDRARVDTGSIPTWMWLSAERVVGEGLRGLRRGTVVCVPGRRWKAVAVVVRLVPRGLLRRFAAR